MSVTKMTILGSGSSGNCAYLESDKTKLLIDCGLSARQIRQRLGSLQVKPEQLTAILISHEHLDHAKGLDLSQDIPVYTSEATIDALIEKGFCCNFEPLKRYQMIQDVCVLSFTIPHDAVEPLGFVFDTGSSNIGVVVDLGHVTKPIMEHLKLCETLLLESNHDLKLVQMDNERPFHVKQRILGPTGHLSNDACAEIVNQLKDGILKRLYLGHLSQEYNRPELALRAVREKIGENHLAVAVANQDTVTETLSV